MTPSHSSRLLTRPSARRSITQAKARMRTLSQKVSTMQNIMSATCRSPTRAIA